MGATYGGLQAMCSKCQLKIEQARSKNIAANKVKPIYKKQSFMTKLKPNLDKAITAYIKAFEKKHGLECDWHFCDGDLMGILQFADYFFSPRDVVYDVDHELPAGMITEWQNAQVQYSLENPSCDKQISLAWYSRGLRFEDVAGK
jgi:hypothetical protein